MSSTLIVTEDLIKLRQHHVFPLTKLRGGWRYLPQPHEQLQYCQTSASWYVSTTNLARIHYILARFSQDPTRRHRPTARNTVEQHGYCRSRRQRPRVRRVYTAKIAGRKSDVTVAVYQGEGAQEVCLYILFFSRCSLIM
jgi:hypothetical protein